MKSESVSSSVVPTLCDPVNCSPPGSSVQGIFQARILEWVAISFSRGFSRPRDWTQVSCTAGRVFIDSATRETQIYTSELMKSWLDWQTECSSLLPGFWVIRSLLFPCRYGRIGAEFRRDSTKNWIWNKKSQMEVLVMTLPSTLLWGMRVRITLSLCNYFRLGKHL